MRIKASCCDPAKQCVGFNMIEISDERFMKLGKGGISTTFIMQPSYTNSRGDLKRRGEGKLFSLKGLIE